MEGLGYEDCQLLGSDVRDGVGGALAPGVCTMSGR